MTSVAKLEAENTDLRRKLAAVNTIHQRADIELRTRLADAHRKLRLIDTICAASWVNLGALTDADELPADFGHLAVSVNEIRDALRGGYEGVSEIFYQAFLDGLDERDDVIAVLRKVKAAAAEDGEVLDLLTQLPLHWRNHLNG